MKNNLLQKHAINGNKWKHIYEELIRVNKERGETRGIPVYTKKSVSKFWRQLEGKVRAVRSTCSTESRNGSTMQISNNNFRSSSVRISSPTLTRPARLDWTSGEDETRRNRETKKAQTENKAEEFENPPLVMQSTRALQSSGILWGYIMR